MKTERKILFAFILNFAFSVFEFIGGIFTGSIAIMSDAVHDIGDAASIGTSYFLEKKSKRKPDSTHTFGYARYSLLGGLITVLILIIGSAIVISNAIERILSPTEIKYETMIFFAAVGVSVNFLAAILTHKGNSLNQMAVNLHMLEDVLGWLIVLIGAVVMKFTDFALLDPILSIAVALLVIVNALRNIKEIFGLLVDKAPNGTDVEEIREHLLKIDDVTDVHHLHVWSLSESLSCATLHVVSDADFHLVKKAVKEELSEHGITHATVELESVGELCSDTVCSIDYTSAPSHHHHHSH